MSAAAGHRSTMELEPTRPPLLQSGRAGSGGGGAAKQLWLDAWADPVAGLQAFSACITTCNLCGDGDWRLVVADADCKLKVWKGTHRATEMPLPEPPVAVAAFLSDLAAPRLPILAVAAGAAIYMFRNLRPCFKFTAPHAGASTDEELLWQRMQAGEVSAEAAAQQLQQLQLSGVGLTARSSQLLLLSDPAAQQEYAATSSASAGDSSTFFTCMAVVPHVADQPDGVGQLVVGTEDARLLLLTPDGTAVAASYAVPAVPAFLAVSGGIDTGFWVAAAARDGRVYSLRPGGLSRTAIQLNAQPVGVVCLGKQLVVGTMADALQCFSASGAKQFSLLMPASILGLQLLPISGARSLVNCIVVALANGEVRLYNDRSLVSVHTSDGGGPVVGLCGGRYAREDNSLIAVTAAGGLDIKIMPRSANLEAAAAISSSSGVLTEQEQPLDVPKKTRLFVEQTQRERGAAADMHRVLQRELAKMRLATARALVKVLTDGQGTHAAAGSLALSVTVQGLGPRLRLLISLTNEGRELVTGLQVLVLASGDRSALQVHTPHFVVPNLVPMLHYTYMADVTCLQPHPCGSAGSVQVLVVSSSAHHPLLRALVSLPPCEPDDD